MAKGQRFIQMVLEEIFGIEGEGVMYKDNETAMYLTKNEHVSTRTKHIDVRQHCVRDHVSQGYGRVLKIKSEDNFADILTKNTSVGIFIKLGKALMSGFEGFEELFKISHIQREND